MTRCEDYPCCGHEKECASRLSNNEECKHVSATYLSVRNRSGWICDDCFEIVTDLFIKDCEFGITYEEEQYGRL